MRWKHVLIHVNANAYVKMEMKNGGEIMSYIVTFGGRKKSKYTESENDIFLSFQNMTFDQNRTFWMQLHVRHFVWLCRANGSEKWNRWKWKRKMGLHACADGKWGEKHVIAFVGWDVRCNDMKMECERWQCFRMKRRKKKFLGKNL